MDSFLLALSNLSSGWVILSAFAGVLWGIFGGALPGVVIGGRTDTTKREHHVTTGRHVGDGLCDAVGVISHVIGIGQRETPLAEGTDELGEVLVLTLTR